MSPVTSSTEIESSFTIDAAVEPAAKAASQVNGLNALPG